MWVLQIAVALSAGPVERVESATRVLQQVRAQYATGQAQAEDVYRWSVRVYEAERDAGKPGAARGHLSRMRELAATAEKLAADGMAPVMEIDATRFYVAEAEAWANARPQPEAEAAPAPAKPAGAIEACFTECDGAFAACSQEANNFRLGVGEVTHGDPACEQAAEAECGPGKSSSKVACRDAEVRACLAGKMQAQCTAEQTKCNARCR